MTKKVFCQSCGMPLAQAVDFGTERNGKQLPNIVDIATRMALGHNPILLWKKQLL